MFTYLIVNEDESTTVIPEGELEYDVSHEFENIVSGRMGLGSLLSFNMGKVPFLDSAGVGFLLQMKTLAEKRNGSFEMRHLQKSVKQVLDKPALNEFLNVSKDTVADLIHKNKNAAVCMSDAYLCPQGAAH